VCPAIPVYLTGMTTGLATGIEYAYIARKDHYSVSSSKTFSYIRGALALPFVFAIYAEV